MRALLLVLDSVGCGQAPDAAAYGNEGANTLGHVGAQTPNLDALGLAAIMGREGPPPCASWGRMNERSAGKDTTAGHWEIAGVITNKPLKTFEKFPELLIRAMEIFSSVTFIGNYAQSGTAILDELGEEHVRTGNPIIYTSADSVLQIAAHEDVIPLERLYQICADARINVNAHRIGRVIARPFTGKPGAWVRTSGRRDFSLVPPPTILNAISASGLPVRGIGKISDIFAASGLTDSTPTKSNAEGMATITRLWGETERGLLFANLVDFDMLFGHRRDPAGYATALAEFDAWLPSFLKKVTPDDLVIITADHGNDPTWTGTDHTREQVPLLVLHGQAATALGTRETFADIAATLAKYFALPEPWKVGEPFI